jgi:hypothetical protein
MFKKIKDWSGWSEAGSIFIARMEVVSGFLTGVLGGIDWTPVMTLDFTQPIADKTLIILGLSLVFKGVISEMTRRRNAKDL